MRTHFLNYLSISLILLLVGACSSSKTMSPEALKTAQQVQEKISARNYKLEVSVAEPARGRSIQLNYAGYNLEIRNDSAFAFLPFYGVATSAPVGGGNGIKFAEPMQQYSEKKSNKGWNIGFKINTNEFHYNIFIDIYNDGSSSIRVSSLEQDNMSFIGQMDLD